MDSNPKDFETQVGALLELLGYTVTHDVRLGGRQGDLMAKKMDGPFSHVFLVECKYLKNNAGMSDIEPLANRLRAAHSEYPEIRGILVTTKGFSKDTKTFAQRMGIEIFTYYQLSKSLYDFSSYLTGLVRDFESSLGGGGKPISKVYISQDGVVTPTGESVRLEEFVHAWMNDSTSNGLVILGETGMGKTTLTKKIARDLAYAHGVDSDSPIPIRIELKEAAAYNDFGAILLNHFAVHGIGLTPAAFSHLVEEGAVILILDGFDEMATYSNDKITMKAFRMLNKVIEGKPKAKLMLTCRTQYFKSDEVIRRLLDNPDEYQVLTSEGGTELYKAVVKKPNYRMSFIKGFNEFQIKAFLENVYGKNWEKYLEAIKDTYNLEELARRPILLDMIAKSLPSLLQKGRKITAADLYETYTEMWIQRDSWRETSVSKRKAKFAQELAWSLWSSERNKVHWSELASYIRDYYSDIVRTVTDLEYADSEIRTASFLIRDSTGNYSFAHRSFLEFFLAKLFAEEIATGEPRRFGRTRLTNELVLFLKDLVKTPRSLFQILRSTRKPIVELGNYLGANCMRVLLACELFPASEDLSDTIIPATDLTGANLSGMSFRNADLSDSILSKANLESAVLTKARLLHCDFTGANLRGAHLNECDIEGADFTGANLEGCDLRRSNFISATIDKETLSKAIVK